MAAAVTEAEIRALIAQWNQLQDRQAGLADFLPMVAAEGFYLEFDGRRWEGHEGLAAHQLMKRQFFDEHHETFEIHVVGGAEATHARTLAHWDARYRPGGGPHSRQIKTLVEHDWEFRRDRSGRAVMQGHKVLRLEYLPGFGPDETPDGGLPQLSGR